MQKSYFTYRKRRIKQKRRAGVDPIKTAFDRMKRVKNPPIPLKNFASIESMREEINEVVAFLQNPKAFQEMGARAPRVCCFALRLYAYHVGQCPILSGINS